jgi:hypothetical protein
MSRWLRINEDCIDNPKILKLPEALRWQWVALLCVASKNDGVLPPIDDVALCLRVPEAKAAEFITKLVKARLIDRDGDVFVPHNWKKRQFKTDGSDPTNAQRQKRYRDRHRNDSNAVTDNDSNDVMDKRPQQNRADSEAEHSRADARELDEIGLKQEGLLRAAFTAECVSRPKAPDMAIIKTWLLDGITVGTISKTVPPILRRKADMASLSYCDAAVRSEHAKTAPSLQVVSSRVWVDEGTEEWNSHQAVSFEKTGRGTPICDHKDENGRVTGRRGWYFASKWGEGFNDFGELIDPASEDHAA